MIKKERPSGLFFFCWKNHQQYFVLCKSPLSARAIRESPLQGLLTGVSPQTPFCSKQSQSLWQLQNCRIIHKTTKEQAPNTCVAQKRRAWYFSSQILFCRGDSRIARAEHASIEPRKTKRILTSDIARYSGSFCGIMIKPQRAIRESPLQSNLSVQNKKESQWLSAKLYSAKQIKFLDSLRPCNFRLYIWNYMA